MGDSNVNGDGGEVDGDGGGVDGGGSGGTSPSRQGAKTETSVPPKFVGGGGGAAELFLKKTD
jgi:hypothetical protein